MLRDRAERRRERDERRARGRAGAMPSAGASDRARLVRATKRDVEAFLAERSLAIVGVSRGHGKFGNAAARGLRAAGYRVFAVHPSAEAIAGHACYRSLARLPEPVGGLVTVVPPAQTEAVVRDAAAAGIRRVWMQQGSESPAALEFCAANGIMAVPGECILMFLSQAAGFHRFHRWLRGAFGHLPS